MILLCNLFLFTYALDMLFDAYVGIKELGMNQCNNCQSYDIERVRRKFYQRFFIRRIIQCRQCDHVQKFFKYDFLNKSNTAANKL